MTYLQGNSQKANTAMYYIDSKRNIYGDNTMQTMICPKCKYQAQKKGEQFCSKCGSKLEPVSEKIFCKGCGKELNNGEQFCGKCGTPRKKQLSGWWYLVFVLIGLTAVIGISATINSCISNHAYRTTGRAI